MPSPPCAFAVVVSSWANRLKTLVIFSGEIPMPVSHTETTTWSLCRLVLIQIRPPGSVYLAALFRRLEKTWVSRTGSASSQSGSVGEPDRQFMPGCVDHGSCWFRAAPPVHGTQVYRCPGAARSFPGDAGDFKQVVNQPAI